MASEFGKTRSARAQHRRDEDSGVLTAKIIAGAVAGILILGGALYAYRVSTATTPSQQLARNAPAASPLANDQYPAAVPEPRQSASSGNSGTQPADPAHAPTEQAQLPAVQAQESAAQ